MECKILIIDNQPDLTLVKESISNLPIPAAIDYTDSVIGAIGMIEALMPDIIMIGSDLVIKGTGFPLILRYSSIPIIVLCESWGLSRILKDSTSNVYYIPRPFDIEQIPILITKAFDLCHSFKKGRPQFTHPK